MVAKDLFFRFLGSKYQMMREGVLELYLSYNISKDKEQEWIEQLFLLLYSRLEIDINDTEALYQIAYLIECHALSNGALLLCQLITARRENITSLSESTIILGRIARAFSTLSQREVHQQIIQTLESFSSQV